MVFPVAATLVLAACSSGGSKKNAAANSSTSSSAATAVTLQAFSPEPNSIQGVCGTGIVLDFSVRSKDPNMVKAGIRPAQQGQPGRNPLMQNFVATLSTTDPTLGGPQANLAGLFQVVSVSQQPDGSSEVWLTWINGVARWGIDIDSTLDAYVLGEPAPPTVPADRTGLNVVSNVVHVPFHVAGSVGSTPCATTNTTGASSSTTGRTTTTARTTTSKATTTTKATTSTSTSTPPAT
jgi:hypothetical protein